MRRTLVLTALSALVSGCSASPVTDAADARAIDNAVEQAELQKQAAQNDANATREN